MFSWAVLTFLHAVEPGRWSIELARRANPR